MTLPDIASLPIREAHDCRFANGISFLVPPRALEGCGDPREAAPAPATEEHAQGSRISVAGGATALQEIAARASETLGLEVTVEDGPAAPRHHLAPPPLSVTVDCDSHEATIVLQGTCPGDAMSARLAGAVVALIAEEVRVAARPTTSEELKDHFIRELLLGRLDDEVDVRRQSQILGLDLGRPRSVLLIDAARYILGDEEGPARASAALRARHVIAAADRYFRLPDATICAYLGDGEVVVLKASSSRDLEAWTRAQMEHSPSSWADLGALKRAAGGLQRDLTGHFRHRVDVAVGRYHPGVEGFAASYEDCRLALELGKGDGARVHSLDQIGLPALIGVGDGKIALSLAARLLEPLRRSEELLATLKIFLQHNCSVRETAEVLVVHRNTLGYRLDKIAALTGFDPRHFEDAVQVRIALELIGRADGQVHKTVPAPTA